MAEIQKNINFEIDLRLNYIEFRNDETCGKILTVNGKEQNRLAEQFKLKIQDKPLGNTKIVTRESINKNYFIFRKNSSNIIDAYTPPGKYIYFIKSETGSIYFSISPYLLHQFSTKSENAEFEKYMIDSGGVGHPRLSTVMGIGCCIGNNWLSIGLGEQEYQSFKLDTNYLDSFSPNIPPDINASIKGSVARMEDDTTDIKVLLATQSGMDSALLTAIANKVLEKRKKSTNKLDFYSLHCDVSPNHYLGSYQRGISRAIAENFNWPILELPQRMAKEVVLDPTDDSYYVFPKSAWLGLATDFAIKEYLQKHFHSEPVLLTYGLKTEISLPFNHTLFYVQTPVSKLFGILRRFMFGKHGMSILFKIAKARYSDSNEALAMVSFSVMRPLSTGRFGGTIPDIFNYFEGSRKNANLLLALLRDIAEDYTSHCKATGLDVDVCVYHSIIREQLHFSLKQRSMQSLMPNNCRVSYMSDNASNSLSSLRNIPSQELLNPKYNVRQQLKALGCDIDKIVKSIKPGNKVIFLHFIHFFVEQSRLFILFWSSIYKFLTRKR